jgi:hypothetical protein
VAIEALGGLEEPGQRRERPEASAERREEARDGDAGLVLEGGEAGPRGPLGLVVDLELDRAGRG